MTRARAVASVVAPLALLLVAGILLDGNRHVFDLTATRSLTLTSQTRDVVRNVRQRVRVYAFIGPSEPGRPEASALLERYHRLNPKVTFRVADPAQAPGVVQQLGVDPSVDAVAASIGKRVARAPTVTEVDVTSVLAQVTRNVSAIVCMAIGHGEADPASEKSGGIAAGSRLLQQNGYQVKPLDLLTAPTVPRSCAGLVVAAPTAPLGDAAARAVADYLDGGGRAVVMADPISTVDLSPLVAAHGLAFRRGILVEQNADAHLPDDPVAVIVRRYGSSNPMVRRLPPTLFPAAEAVIRTDNGAVGGLATDGVVVSTGQSYLKVHVDRSSFTAGEDIRGPITIGAVADKSRVTGTNIERSRVAAFGNAAFATNQFITEGGNARLFLQTVDWATQNEDLVPLNANIPAYRPLELTAGRTRSARVLAAGVVPAMFLLAGASVWFVRRRR